MLRRTLKCAVAAGLCLLTAVCSSPTTAEFKPDAAFAAQFADEWLAAWNAKDLPKILGHYSEDVEFSSPFVIARGIDPNGRVVGKQALSSYWGGALMSNPELHFELQNVLLAVDSIAILYKTNAGGSERMAAEVFHFNAEGSVYRSYAHYSQPAQAL